MVVSGEEEADAKGKIPCKELLNLAVFQNHLGILLEKQILRPHPRPTQSKSLGIPTECDPPQGPTTNHCL